MKILISTILVVGSLAFVGCRTIEDALYKRQITPETISTNEAGVIVIHPATTNLVQKEFVQTAIDGTGALPFPYAGFLPILLGWGYSAYRSYRNKKSAQALVTGVEAVRQMLQDTEEGRKFDQKLKKAVREHQVAAGVVDEVAKLVRKYTSSTTNAGSAGHA